MTNPATRRIVSTFNSCFGEIHGVVMEGGAPEPLYVPRSGAEPARLYFRADYPASALHEAAHWCRAGNARRTRVDFGFSYLPPPRLPVTQRAFLDAERQTQALESIFASASGVTFRASLDDIGGIGHGMHRFEHLRARYEADVEQSRTTWLAAGLPPRAERFRQALIETFS